MADVPLEQRLVTLTMSVLGFGTLLAVWAAPQIISLYQSDSPANHEAFQLTVVFARFLLPQIFFYGLFSILWAKCSTPGTSSAR